MSEVYVRLFAPEDTDSLAALSHEMSVHYSGANASSPERVRAHLISATLGPNSDVRVVVAKDGTQVIGMATVSVLYPAPKEKAQLFMKELYVQSDRRGEGIGERMMRWIAAYAVENQCSRFDWVVDAPNNRAVEFYSSLGATQLRDKLYYRLSADALKAFAEGWHGHDA